MLLEAHDRLVVQLELAGLDRVLQLRAQLEPLDHALVHRRLEDSVAPLLSRLAMYIATSAFRSSSAASGTAISRSTRQIPMLARGKTCLFSMLVGISRAWRIRTAASAASGESDTPSRRTANSSPPKRATVSVG